MYYKKRLYIWIIIKTTNIMETTIKKNNYTNYYEVIKWDNNFKPIETFYTKKKHEAQAKFSEFFKETYNN